MTSPCCCEAGSSPTTPRRRVGSAAQENALLRGFLRTWEDGGTAGFVVATMVASAGPSQTGLGPRRLRPRSYLARVDADGGGSRGGGPGGDGSEGAARRASSSDLNQDGPTTTTASFEPCATRRGPF